MGGMLSSLLNRTYLLSAAAYIRARAKSASLRPTWFAKLFRRRARRPHEARHSHFRFDCRNLGSLATISCCLPLGFAAALGAGAVSAFFTTLRPCLLGLPVALLGFGSWQRRRADQCSIRGGKAGTVLLWAAVAVILGMILFPQEIAALIANRFLEK